MDKDKFVNQWQLMDSLMEKIRNLVHLENEISRLKKMLDALVDSEQISSGKVLQLSRELDLLISGYYSLKSSLGSH
jgi:hypothetical protein